MTQKQELVDRIKPIDLGKLTSVDSKVYSAHKIDGDPATDEELETARKKVLEDALRYAKSKNYQYIIVQIVTGKDDTPLTIRKPNSPILNYYFKAVFFEEPKPQS